MSASFQGMSEVVGSIKFSSSCLGLRQSGIIRTNCLDCLDRTNAVQYGLAWDALLRFCGDIKLADLAGDPTVYRRLHSEVRDAYLNDLL